MPEELAVDLHPLLARLLLIAETPRPRSPPQFNLMRGSFLFGNRIVNSLCKGRKQGQVYGAGDVGTVSEIEGSEAGEDLLDGAVRR